MRFQLVSDLHLEFQPFEIINDDDSRRDALVPLPRLLPPLALIIAASALDGLLEDAKTMEVTFAPDSERRGALPPLSTSAAVDNCRDDDDE